MLSGYVSGGWDGTMNLKDAGVVNVHLALSMFIIKTVIYGKHPYC